jgi:hypothetical protein
MAKWQQAPAVEQEARPRWMEAEVIDEGGPDSQGPVSWTQLGRAATQMVPAARARDAQITADRAARDTAAMMQPGPLGSLNTALRTVQMSDRGFIGSLAKRAADMQGGFQSGASDGATFGFDDEIIGLLSDTARDQRRGMKRAAATDTPVTNFAGQITGGIVSPLNKPLAAAVGVKNVATAGKSVAQLGREGFRVGGAGGGLYGFGNADGDFTERVRGAAEGAALGMVGGGLLGAGAGAVGNKLSTGKFLPGQYGSTILDTAPQQLGIPNSSVAALRQTLKNSGYSRDDIDRGVVNIADRLKVSSETGDRAGLFALELQKEFPAAQQNIQDVFQQLMTAPPTQGKTGRVLTDALDEQYGSQGKYFDDVAQQRLGSSTVADEMDALAARRAEIGTQRDRSLRYAETDGRARGLRNQMAKWYEDFSSGDGADTEVMGTMRAAARELGFSGRTEAADAMRANPVALLNKFQELTFAKSKTPSGASPVLMAARSEAQKLIDDASRFGREADSVAFAKKAQGETGPFKQRQQEFRENYSQEEAIDSARGMLNKARDPVYEDEIATWFNSLPEGEKSLVRTVWRQDLQKMLRGGNIDQDGAYLTNLKKLGLNSTLKRVLGDDGEAISRAITQLADEQKGLIGLDPRKGLQERVVRGPAADRARNLYTTNAFARLGDRIPPASQLADLALMGGGQLPYVTIARQALKSFRPRARTREGLAQILAMRSLPDAPPPTGRLSRMTPEAAAGASGASTQANQGGPPRMTAPNVPGTLRTSQRAPWQPAQVPQGPPSEVVPRIQTGAQRKADVARQRALDARQRAANAQARKADAETIRKTLADARQAEADAKVAEIQARNAARVTKAQLKAVADAARAKVKAAKAAGKGERELAAREAIAQTAKRDADEYLESALDRERRMKRTAKAEADALKDRSLADRVREGTDARVNTYTRAQKIEVAKKNATGNVDPVRTFEETGHLAMNIGDNPIVILNVDESAGIKNSRDFVRMLSRVEDDMLGGNRNKPEKWSPLTMQLRQILGEEKLIKAIRAGEIPGWRTPDERATFETGKKIAKTAAGATAAVVAAGGAAEGYRRYDAGAQKRRAKAIMESPELTKIVQRSLKAVKQYDGRADGKFDGDVMTGVAQFQGTYGLGKTSDPGTLDTATLEKLEEMLIFEGKTKLADEISNIRRNKLKAKEN